MTENGERILVNKFVELFAELSCHKGTAKAKMFIHWDGVISIEFDEPVKTEIARLYDRNCPSLLVRCLNLFKKGGIKNEI